MCSYWNKIINIYLGINKNDVKSLYLLVKVMNIILILSLNSLHIL